MIIRETKIGESLSIGFLFNETFLMSRLETVKVFIGSKIYAHTIIDHMVRCELKSDDTNKLNGTMKLTLDIDDSILGVKKILCGDLKFNVTNAQNSNESVNAGYDVVIPITINEQAITIDDIMYNYVKGDTGTIGDILTYPSVITPEDEDVTVIQHGSGSENSFSWSWKNIKLSLKNFFEGYFEPLKGSDDNYVTDAEKIKLSKLSGTNTGDQDLSGLQHKEEGKGLSTNDYTTAEKNKLAGIESGAQVNAPNTVVDSNYVHTDNNFTTELKNKIDSITAIFTTELKSAYDTCVTWVNNATQNVKNIIGIVDGGSINKFLTEAGTFAPISVGGASSSPLYYNPTPSGIGTAKTLSYIPYPTEVEAQYTLTTTEQLLTSYVYPEPIAIDTIDAGNWISKAVGRISSSSGSSFLRIEFSIYKDGVKTLLFSKSSDEINNTTFESIPGDAANGIFSVDPTGFLWVDVYGVTSGANRTLYLKIGGSNASFIQTPLRARHDGLRDINGDLSFQHFDSTSEKTTPIAADSLGLWDSVTSTFKKLSLTNLLVFLQGFFIGKQVISYAIDSALNDAVAGVKIIDNPPYNFNLIDIFLTVAGQAPTGGKFYVNVYKNGVSIFSTIITVDDGEVSSRTASVPYVFASTPTNFITTDLISIEIVQAGSTTAGKNPIINFIVKQN